MFGRKRQADEFGRLDVNAEGGEAATTEAAAAADPSVKPSLASRLMRSGPKVPKAAKAPKPGKAPKRAAGAGTAAVPTTGVPPDPGEYRRWQGKKARDASGKRSLGTVQNVFLDDGSREPSWVSLQNLSDGRLILPYAGVLVLGTEPVFPYTAKQVKGAPRVGSDSQLSKKDEEQLRTYYGVTREPTTTAS